MVVLLPMILQFVQHMLLLLLLLLFLAASSAALTAIRTTCSLSAVCLAFLLAVTRAAFAAVTASFRVFEVSATFTAVSVTLTAAVGNLLRYFLERLSSLYFFYLFPFSFYSHIFEIFFDSSSGGEFNGFNNCCCW